MADQADQMVRKGETTERAGDEKMCCEGGMTAAEHRAKSPDGKCCTDE